MKARTLTFQVILLLVLVFAASDIFAANLTVTKTEDTADGVCDTDCSLREAVAAAASGDIILFSSLFDSPQTITLIDGQIVIAKSLTLTGPGSGLLSISGNNSGRILHISGGGTISISGLRLRDGRLDTSQDFNGGAIHVISSVLNLSRMTFSNNYAQFSVPPPNPQFGGAGGAIYSDHSTVTISDSEIRENESPGGAGINTWLGTLTIERSSFRDNLGAAVASQFKNTITVFDSVFADNAGSAIAGGGEFTVSNTIISGNQRGGISTGASNDVLVIIGCTIINNQNTNGLALVGGGVANFGIGRIRSSTIINNRSSGRGGGIFNAGTLYVSDSVVSENRAGTTGGGIITGVNQAFFTNTTISGNIAQRGGGLYNLVDQANPGGRVFATNVTFSNNRATSGKGGGLLQDPNGIATLGNCVFANNHSTLNEPDVSGAITSNGFNIVKTTAGSSGWIGSDLLNQDPLLAPLGSNGGGTFTHALLPASPAIDAGSNELAIDPSTMLPLKTDQRGRARYAGSVGVVDIGAYEANYSSSPVSLEGRLVTSTGRGIGSARVVLTDDVSVTRYAITNPFGYYRFLDLPVAITYTITASDKLYSFAVPIVVTTDQDRDDLIFLGMF